MRLLVERSDAGEFRRRYRWMLLSVVLAFLALIGRAAQLQVFERDIHKAQARDNIIGQVTLATTRGVIRDRAGRILAANRPSYDVYIVPDKLDLEETWPRVAQLMDLTPAEETVLREKVSKQAGKKRQQQLLLKVDVRREVFAALKTHGDELPGVVATPVPVRYYPYGELGARGLATCGKPIKTISVVWKSAAIAPATGLVRRASSAAGKATCAVNAGGRNA